MIIACHILVGAAIAQNTHNPALGLLFAFLSHYVLDFIPHEEYIRSFKELAKKPMGDVFKLIFDFSLAVAIVLIFSENKLLAVAGGLLGASPDIDNLFFLFPNWAKNRFVKKDEWFHSKKVHYFKYKKIPTVVRILNQAIVAVTALYFLSLR
jgi:hypothetical protein